MIDKKYNKIDINIKNENYRGIYIHIPFCKQKCGYCDFHSFAKIEKHIKEYVKAVVKEIEIFSGNLEEGDKNINTIFFGGRNS